MEAANVETDLMETVPLSEAMSLQLPADGATDGQSISASDKSLYNRLEAEAGIPNLSHTLPADFRVQVQMLYWMADQRRLLEELLGQHAQVETQIDCFKRDVLIGHEDLGLLQSTLSANLERTEKKIDELHGKKHGSLSRAGSQEHACLESRHLEHQTTMAELMQNMKHGDHDSTTEKESAAPPCVAKNLGNVGSLNTLLSAAVSNRETEDPELCDGRKLSVTSQKSGSRYTSWEKLGDSSCGSPSQIMDGKLDGAQIMASLETVLHGESLNDLPADSRCSCRKYVLAILDNQCFDPMCGVVILFNALHVGLVAETNIQYALTHVGGGPPSPTSFDRVVNLTFFCFYLVELLLRLYAYRCKFFTDRVSRSWNVFDLLLVVSAGYDIVMEISGIKPVNVSWLRLVRLVKMVKMLRVVRVMKCFRQMRTMLNSMTHSWGLLLWAVLILVVILYIFGLCFLFSVTGMLHEAPNASVSEDTMINIKMYWSSVPVVIASLFMTLTGGADWENIAEPIKRVGILQYVIFLLYVAFGVITLMNVLTGLIVDSAMKATVEDEDDVVTQIFESDGDAIRAIAEIYIEDEVFQQQKTIDWQPFEDNLKDKNSVATKFLETFEITAVDAFKVFGRLSHMGKGGRVPIDAFITGCSKARGAEIGVELFSLSHDTKKIVHQLRALMQFVESRFDEMNTTFLESERHDSEPEFRAGNANDRNGGN